MRVAISEPCRRRPATTGWPALRTGSVPAPSGSGSRPTASRSSRSPSSKKPSSIPCAAFAVTVRYIAAQYPSVPFLGRPRDDVVEGVEERRKDSIVPASCSLGHRLRGPVAAMAGSPSRSHNRRTRTSRLRRRASPTRSLPWMTG